MKLLYDFPKAATFGRMVAKNKIYEHASPNAKVKELFVQEVEKITWAYKLSPGTINIPAGEDVQELQIFVITLRTETLAQEVLQTIDKAIPSPILFQLNCNGKSRYMAAYKRVSEGDKNKWVISSYFETDWITDNSEKTELPIVLNMGVLYQTILKAIIPLPSRDTESLDGLVARVDLLRTKEREADKVGARIKKEKQFNRRVELNRSLNELKAEIDDLKH